MSRKFSILEIRVANLLEHYKFSPCLREFRFHPIRMWRFDFAWVNEKVALEVEGGIWKNGAHNRGIHYTSDCEKYNQAQILGWKVLRYTDKNIGQIVEDLTKLGIKKC